MSSRVVLEALRSLGGQATAAQLRAVHYLALNRLHRLERQGYVEHVGDVWRLTAFACTPPGEVPA